MAKRTGVNLTKARIEEIKPGASIQRVWDLDARGLGLQVTPGGVYSWVFSYRFNGVKNMTTLGRWPEMPVPQARRAADAARSKLECGIDPTESKRANCREAEAKRKEATVSALCDRYIAEHIKLENKPSWQKEATRLIERIIRPELGKIRVSELAPEDVSSLLHKIHRTPTQARLVRAVLRTMLGRAEEWGLRSLGTNPVIVVKHRSKDASRKKDRHLSDVEIAAIGKVLRESKESPITLGLFRLLMLTGCRKSELIGDAYKEIPPLTWSSVNLEEATIQLDYHKTSGKTGVRYVYLCSAAQEVLKALPRVLGNPCVFPGKLKGRAVTNYLLLWNRIKDAVAESQNELPKPQRVDISNVTVHDLRRSFASVAARLKYPELFESALLGHAAGNVTQGYARLGADPLRDAVEVIGSRISGLLDGNIEIEAEKPTIVKHGALA